MALETVGSSPTTHPKFSLCGVKLAVLPTLGCSQVVRHGTLTPAFVGSSPATPAYYDPLAQLAEHLTFNQGVWSSNLQWVTLYSVKARNDFFLPYRYIYIVDYPPIRE